MASLLNFLKEHQQVCLGMSVAAFGGYLLYRARGSRQNKKQNLLQVSLKELINKKKIANVSKIVITSDPKSQGNFRRNLINQIKARLTEANIKVLINCSPQKLLQAGCECYLQSMQADDKEYVEYYQNALKSQYLIEDTIISIETISLINGPIVMICDNNPMDIRLMNQSDQLWTQTLARNGITEDKIIEGVDLIIHAIEQPCFSQQDQRMETIWNSHPHYHKIESKEGALRQKYDQAFKLVTDFIQNKQVQAQPHP